MVAIVIISYLLPMRKLRYRELLYIFQELQVGSIRARFNLYNPQTHLINCYTTACLLTHTGTLDTHQTPKQFKDG